MALIGAAIVLLGGVLWLADIARAEELFTLAVAPSIYLMWYFHHADKYKSESTGLLLGTFALGGVAAIIAALIEPKPPQNAGIGVMFLYFLFGVALIEETAKFLIVRFVPYRSKHFDESMDGVIFGIAAGLGFAAVENIFYVFSYGAGIAIFRAFVSVPGHAFYAAVMGYYLGEAKIRKKPWLAVQGLVFAILLHGVFDTLSQLPTWLALFVLPAFVWFVYFKVVKKEIAQAQEGSLYRAQLDSRA